MARIEPEEEDFDPTELEGDGAARVLAEAVRLFNEAEYHAAHEEFEKLWLNTQGEESDLYKGLIQACICLHHFRRDNLDGARKLYSGHRKLLAAYLPHRAGLDIEGFLTDMQRGLRPVMRARGGEPVKFDPEQRPRLRQAQA